jgi:FAD/FMN-containing dehydrogenase
MINRRRLLKLVATAVPFLSTVLSWLLKPSPAGAANRPVSRVRPGNPRWPKEADWDRLRNEIGGRLVKVESPLTACVGATPSPNCDKVFKELKNPYYLGDEVGLTQSLGWVNAWTSKPSVYAVAAETTDDVVAAVNFAREQNLRLVVKGGGHSYQGTSNSADSLLIWTRKMNAITLHNDFVLSGCGDHQAPEKAVSIGAGATWGQTYNAVTTKGGRYVQGGGCMTVGVAGLVQSGGFGPFSKTYGMAAASLLEAEIVTADGVARIANACTNPDLFWGIKGGGGGSLGVVTRLTLRTHELPELFGGAFMTIKATSSSAYRNLVGKIIEFYSDVLFNPHWGEQIGFRPGNILTVTMVFQGLDQHQAETTWKPFLDWLAESPGNFSIMSGPQIVAIPARHFWDPEFMKKIPGLIVSDDRPGAPGNNVFWASNLGETGQVLYAYQSAWIPASLLEKDQQKNLADALFAAAQHWHVTLHVNKGLAGAPPEAIAEAKDTATNPVALDAFALLISGASGPPAYPGVTGREPDESTAREEAEALSRAMNEVRKVLPKTGSYVSESDFFEPSWQESFWGSNYKRLLEVKDKYDPDGLFFVHHGVGSERWGADGFTCA